jgi:hypothetical protein
MKPSPTAHLIMTGALHNNTPMWGAIHWNGKNRHSMFFFFPPRILLPTYLLWMPLAWVRRKVVSNSWDALPCSLPWTYQKGCRHPTQAVSLELWAPAWASKTMAYTLYDQLQYRALSQIWFMSTAFIASYETWNMKDVIKLRFSFSKIIIKTFYFLEDCYEHMTKILFL